MTCAMDPASNGCASSKCSAISSMRVSIADTRWSFDGSARSAGKEADDEILCDRGRATRGPPEEGPYYHFPFGRALSWPTFRVPRRRFTERERAILDRYGNYHYVARDFLLERYFHFYLRVVDEFILDVPYRDWPFPVSIAVFACAVNELALAHLRIAA